MPCRALDLLSGYAQSKWVAEQVVLRGSPVATSYRVGSVSGFNPQDSINMLLRGVSQLGMVAINCVPQLFPVISASRVASELVLIMKKQLEGLFKEFRVFHLISTKPLTAEKVFANIKQVDSETFLGAANSIRDFDHPLFFVKASLGVRKQGIDQCKTSDANRRAVIGEERDNGVSAEQLWNFALMEK